MTQPQYETIPISTLERLNSHWFSEDNKRFFKSMWDSYALQNKGSIYAYFVSSEKHTSYYANINEPRKYTIRKFNMRTGDMAVTNDEKEPMFAFQYFSTKKQAEKALREYLKIEPIKAELIQFINDKIKEKQYMKSRLDKEIEELTKELQAIPEQ